MSRQLEQKNEEAENKKRLALVKALDGGIPSALSTKDIELLGFAFRYDAYNSLMTIKAVVGGVKSVAFVGSDSVINCILRAHSDACNDKLQWRPDKYHQ